MGTYFGYENALQLGAVGATYTSSGVSVSQPIPNASDGNRARCVLLTTTGYVYVKYTRGAGTCTTNDHMISPNFPMIVNCRQFDTISYLQETASAKINITPLEA
jgi:hypothetical protein